MTRWMVAVAGVAALLAVPAAAQTAAEPEIEAAIKASIVGVESIDELREIQSETVVPLGGGRAPIIIEGWSRLAFTDAFDARAPAFGDNSDIEVIHDFVPETNDFYDVSPWRVVHAFKLSEPLDGCTGLQEFALFYTVPGAAAFPRVENLNSPDVGRTHATAMVCENGATRAIHVQASAIGTQFGTPHRIMLVTAPDPRDPSTRCTYLIVITENPEVEVDPTLTTADNVADPASWSFRQYGMGDATQTNLDVETSRLEYKEYDVNVLGTAPAAGDDGFESSGDDTAAPAADDDGDAPGPEDDALGADDGDTTSSEDPVVVDVTPDGAEDGGGNGIWIALGVFVVLGVAIVIGFRLFVGGRSSSGGVVPSDDASGGDEPGREPAGDSPPPALPAPEGPGGGADDSDSGVDPVPADPTGTGVRGTAGSPTEEEVPVTASPPQPTACDWELRFDDGTTTTTLRPAAAGHTVCCIYTVTMQTEVWEHEVAARIPHDEPEGRDTVPLHTIDIDGTGLAIAATTRSEPTDDTAVADPVASDSVWRGTDGDDDLPLSSSITHDETTTVKVELDSRCTDAANVFDASYAGHVSHESGHECGNRAGEPTCDVDLRHLVDLQADAVDDVNALATTSVADSPQDPDHRHPDRAAGGLADAVDATDTRRSNATAWRASFRSTATVAVGQDVPVEVWPTTDRVVTHAEGTVTHHLTLTGTASKGDCAATGCCTGNPNHVCNCDPAFTLVVDPAGSSIETEDRSWTVTRHRLADATGPGSWSVR